jgi:glycerol-3-phosphate dehydrogenase (NAD(P)+)
MPGNVAVINAGGWGTALAVLLGNAGHSVRLWCRRAELADEIQATRENKTYLPGVGVPREVSTHHSLEAVLEGADAVILAPISRAVRETARSVAPYIRPDTPVLHASKGLELPSQLRLSDVIAQELSTRDVAALSGPTHAEEVGRGMPTAAVVACRDLDIANAFQRLLHGPTFRVYTSTDVVGVELCGALKNVIALATGASDGLGYGDNARAALITRSLVELGRLVEAAGGDARSVSGLAGLGDVVVTCTSRHSRNRWAGEQIGRGRTTLDIVSSTPKVIEGFPATQAAVALAQRYRVEMPVCFAVDAVLNHGLPVQQALAQLMSREATFELPSG